MSKKNTKATGKPKKPNRRGRPKLPEGQRKVACNVNLPPKLAKELDKAATRKGVSRSQLVGDTLNRALLQGRQKGNP